MHKETTVSSSSMFKLSPGRKKILYNLYGHVDGKILYDRVLLCKPIFNLISLCSRFDDSREKGYKLPELILFDLLPLYSPDELNLVFLILLLCNYGKW